MEEPINILDAAYAALSPFSAHEVVLDGVRYKTAEHAYQALRVVPQARERIVNADTPRDAWQEGQYAKERNELLPDYDKDALMERILRAKLTQHADVADVLRATEDRELLKVHDTDVYWGTDRDGSGANRMGTLWMKLRNELR